MPVSLFGLLFHRPAFIRLPTLPKACAHVSTLLREGFFYTLLQKKTQILVVNNGVAQSKVYRELSDNQ